MGVQRRAVPHFKDLFKIFKMRYSMSLYSDGIVFKFRFQKSRFTPKNRSYTLTYVHVCITTTENDTQLDILLMYRVSGRFGMAWSTIHIP